MTYLTREMADQIRMASRKVLRQTTASFTSSLEQKLSGIESGATSNPTIVTKSGNQEVTDTTLVTIDDLLFPLVSGRTYKFHFSLIIETANLATGPKISCDGPTASRFSCKASGPIGVDGAANEFRGEITAFLDAISLTTMPAIDTSYLCQMDGIIVPSASGNLEAMFANTVGVTTTTCMSGSMGMLWAS